MSDFGSEIKILRYRKNVSLRTLASMAKIPLSRMGHIEAGFKLATPDEVEQLLKNLGESNRDDLRELAKQPLKPKKLRDLLPVFVCTKDGKELTEQQLDGIIQAIRRECECPIKEN